MKSKYDDNVDKFSQNSSTLLTGCGMFAITNQPRAEEKQLQLEEAVRRAEKDQVIFFLALVGSLSGLAVFSYLDNQESAYKDLAKKGINVCQGVVLLFMGLILIWGSEIVNTRNALDQHTRETRKMRG